MKRLFLSLAIIACISLTANVDAQNNKRGQQRFSKELNLSADQQQKIKSTSEDFRAKAKELRAKSDLSKEEKQLKANELREQERLAINDILTPDQQTKFKELQKKDNKGPKGKNKAIAKQNKRGQGMKMRVHRGDRMKDLNLTDSQKQKIKALNEEYRTKNKETAQKHREALNNIYTPEQQAKIKDMRGDFRKDRKFTFDGKRGKGRPDEASAAKLKTLRENFEKEKKAVELSRIAPDAQKKKISELRDNFRKEKRQIIMDGRKAKIREKKPV
ncbi:MAG: hypothetical protein LBL79_00260 [Prevotella sp.]|jgi:Spy/CpxP family protein refolding chaperone|nr:hypothetical protein [Prevotella sp.]